MFFVWSALALAAPPPAAPITAEELVGRWQRVGQPEDCAAGAHEFVATGASERVEYRNPVGRHGPSQGQVDGLPDAGYGALLDLKQGDTYRSFRVVRSWPGATGDLVVVPSTLTKEEKRSRDAYYDLVRCPATPPPTASPATASPATASPAAASAPPVNDLRWMEGAWGETGPGFARTEGWFAKRCDEVVKLPTDVAIPARVAHHVTTWPSSRVFHGALLVWTTESGGLAAVQAVWGSDEMLGEASLVDLAPEASDGSLWIRSKFGDRVQVVARDTDHVVFVVTEDGVAVESYFERCPSP